MHDISAIQQFGVNKKLPIDGMGTKDQFGGVQADRRAGDAEHSAGARPADRSDHDEQVGPSGENDGLDLEGQRPDRRDHPDPNAGADSAGRQLPGVLTVLRCHGIPSPKRERARVRSEPEAHVEPRDGSPAAQCFPPAGTAGILPAPVLDSPAKPGPLGSAPGQHRYRSSTG